MSTSSLLIQNISELFTMSSFMTGGKLNRNVDQFTNKKNNVLFMLFTILLMLLLKGLIVFIIYNFLTPKLMESVSINNSFKEISFPEALLMVILFNTLFS